MKRFTIFAYGVLAYVAFNASFLYFAAYLLGFVGPTGDVPFGQALATNLGLVFLFGLTHSGMARDGFKSWLTKYLPVEAERSTFVMQSSIFLALAVWGWQPMSGVVWAFDGVVAIAFYAAFAVGLGTLLLSTFLIDHFELFGLRQIWSHLTNKDMPEPTFKTPLLYRVVRHPMQLGVVIVLFATPEMTVDHLVMALSMTAYVMVGLYFEERSLKRMFGQQYLDYAARVPMLFPTGRFYRDPIATPAE